ncbi:hypothetical protein ZWY2020_030374 [Hordeum vulgare]|nr:hypothetical protein ZWY2020_030374 [Hordeum vulgare]
MDMRLLDLTSGMLRQGENKEIAASRSHGRKGVKGDLRPIMMARLMQTGRPPLPARRNGEVGDLMLGMACVLREGTMPLFGQSSRGGGKTCRLPSPANEVSVSEESEEDDELLIESMQLDHEEYLNESSKWIVPVPLERGNNTPEIQNDVKKVQVTFSSVVRKSLSYADIVTNNWQVLELEGEADPNMKISNDYVVLSPETDNNVDVIPTPPIASEADTRFSKRNACGMQEKVEDRARRLASKKDLEGLQQEDDAGELRSGVELVRTNTMQLMKLCKAVRHGIAGG